MSKYSIEDTTLTAIGDALRAKEQSEDPIPVVDIASHIEALSIGAEEKFLTPEEVYEQYRPADWPVLPDPEEGECYLLTKPYSLSSSVNDVVTPPNYDGDNDELMEYGYIDADGKFVKMFESQGSSSYWSKYGIGSASFETSWKSPEMDNFVVIKSKNNRNPTTSLSNNSSSNASTSEKYAAYVLEAKINCNSQYYFTVGGNYPTNYKGLQFVTFYNNSFANNMALCFKNADQLKTVVFKGQNPFTDPNFTTTGSWSNLFSACYGLLAIYPFKTMSSSAQSLMSNCYCIPSVTVDFSETATAPAVSALTSLISGYWPNLKELYIDNPFNSNSSILSNSLPQESQGLKVKSLNCPLCSAAITSLPNNLTELLNIDYKFNMSSSSPARGLLKRITMAPTMTRSCGTMRIKSYIMTREDLQEWFGSLPVLNSETATLVLTDIISLKQQDIDDVISIATEKGYTVTR